MIIGTVKEIKNAEGRVGLTPVGVDALIKDGNTVLVEKGAGEKSGFSDDSYIKAGAQIIADVSEIYKQAEMIIKVKEPQKSEYAFYREGQILYTYLHLAAEKELTEMLIDRKVVGVAYETIEIENGTLPLLTPMSEVAGRMAVQVGAWFLQKPNGGKGVLLGGVPGVVPGHVVIFGTGVVGMHAMKMAVGLGARVTIFGRNLASLRYIDDIYAGRVTTQFSSPLAIAQTIPTADLVVSGVLVTGAKSPKLITKDMLKTMQEGTVLVDVSIDQGGSFETSKPTSHAEPIYTVDGIVHYCVTNMPGAVPQTSTKALTNATLPYALAIAKKGIKKAALEDKALALGINTMDGYCTYDAVAEAFGLVYKPLESVLK